MSNMVAPDGMLSFLRREGFEIEFSRDKRPMDLTFIDFGFLPQKTRLLRKRMVENCRRYLAGPIILKIPLGYTERRQPWRLKPGVEYASDIQQLRKEDKLNPSRISLIYSFFPQLTELLSDYRNSNKVQRCAIQDIARRVCEAIPKTRPYGRMDQEEKIKVARIMETAARDFLSLVTLG